MDIEPPDESRDSSGKHLSEPVLGCDLILAERKRQIEAEGWSEQHDASHTHGELARAAACYAIGSPEVKAPRRVRQTTGVTTSESVIFEQVWPWEERWWKAGDRVRELVKAGALIAAEIDRLNREHSLRKRHEHDDMEMGS